MKLTVDQMHVVLDALVHAKSEAYMEPKWHPWEDYTPWANDDPKTTRQGWLNLLVSAQRTIEDELSHGTLP